MERIAEAVAKELRNEGHEVVVVTSNRGLPRRSYHNKLEGLELYRYPEYHLPFMEAVVSPGLLGHVLCERFDVLHVHGMTPTITEICVLIAKLKRKPVVVSYHYDAETTGPLASFLKALYEMLLLPIMKLSDVMTVLSPSYARTSPILSRLQGRLILIPGGVDTRRFSSDRIESQRKPDPAIILYVGKIIHYKGIEYLVDAMPTVLARVPNARLILSGKSNNPRYEAMITRRIAISAAKEAILWENEWVDQDKLIQHYRECRVLVLPSVSRREAFGLVLIEAMSIGRPIIATSIPGPSDVVRKDVNGFLVPPRDKEMLAEAIIRVLSDRKTAERMGEMSRDLAKQYDWESVAARHAKVIEECARAHPKGLYTGCI
jgi:glycosyltransferase involved in cell wall biosynthesis